MYSVTFERKSPFPYVKHWELWAVTSPCLGLGDTDNWSIVLQPSLNNCFPYRAAVDMENGCVARRGEAIRLAIDDEPGQKVSDNKLMGPIIAHVLVQWWSTI